MEPRMKRLLCLMLLMLMVGTVSADTLILGATNTTTLYRQNPIGTFADLNTGNGTGLTSTSGNGYSGLTSNATGTTFNTNYRNIQTYNFTPYSGITILDAKLSVRYYSKTVGLGKLTVGITNASPSNVITPGISDYQKVESTILSSNLTSDDFLIGWRGNFTFTNTGVSFLNSSQGGFASIMLRSTWDIDNSFGGVYANNTNSYFRFYQNGDIYNPFLTITYNDNTIPADTTPPASITNLANSTATCTEINWTFNKPGDADFNHTLVMKDGVFYTNLSNTTQYSLWTGLTGGQTYTFSSKTYDIAGNGNLSWVNQSATAGTCATPTPTPTPTTTGTPIPTPSTEPWCGRQLLYFSHTNSSDPTSYERLINYPDGGAEIEENITLKNTMGDVLIDSYISDPGYPNTALLLPGLTRFRTYHFVSGASGITQVNYSVSKRSITGNQTFLWSVESQDINNLNLNEVLTSHVTNVSYALDPTDRILINVSGKTTHSANIQLYWYYQGTNHASHLETGTFYCADTCGCVSTTTAATIAPWGPDINPTTDTRFDFMAWIKTWWWLPVLILIMIMLFRRS